MRPLLFILGALALAAAIICAERWFTVSPAARTARPYAWQRFIRDQNGAFFKIDAAELYHEAHEGYFEEQLVAALRWFESRAPEDFSHLLMLSRLVFDPEEKKICFDGE